MLQRIQSVWLLIAALLSFATLQFSFFGGNKVENGISTFINYTAKENLLVLILTVAVAVAALVSVFLYKDRRQQIKIIIATLLVNILTIVLLYFNTKKFESGTIALTSVVYFAVPVFLVMALLAIRKDEKLVKSADRLR
ncbi:MAG TPA: DUF4293 family protein [Chitinophagaceae bacterium]|nr:DUF4293 domain-containing protein [Chitinophagaceae bacterium]MCC6635880.1 DUF4293 family protein [Chitinophagaceae bacterium]HMZ47025.1 DUF4293 family protein [Chitinophagaceae bacterium]HNE93684.1 DUF4293 family protein [Chitinophagaceae bacterium]HNF30321.1 DUF4293 family protein [Chitinophagaceae bacterium]